MKKAKIRNEKKKDVFLYDTRVTNLFINEFMPKAPGDYVKVYLFGLMFAQMDYEVDIETIAHDLGMDIAEVEQAISYWVKQGVMSVVTSESGDAYELEYVRLVQKLYGTVVQGDVQAAVPPPVENREIKIEDKAAQMYDQTLRTLLAQCEEATGRPLSRKDQEKVVDCIKVYGIEPEVFSYSVQYCTELEKYSVDYISKVALRWSENGCKTSEDVKALLDKDSRRNANYNLIFKAVGFNRLPSPADRELMARWFDEWGFSIQEVLEACKKTAGIREPSLKYVNTVLQNQILKTGGINTDLPGARKKEDDSAPQAKVSRQVLSQYYEYLRNEAQNQLDARTDEICAKYPEMRGILQMMKDTTDKLMEISFAKGAKEKRDELREVMHELKEEKRKVLTRNGYSEDYLEIEYKCARCKDTGETEDGRVCVCSPLRAEEAYKWMREKSKH